MSDRWRKLAQEAYRQHADTNVLDVAATMTLILLILYSGDYWYLRIPMTIVCALALIYRPLYRKPDFWFIIAVVMASGNFWNWPTLDNHKYLMNYWCFALFLVFLSKDREATLAVNARLLIGLSFGFATVWKAISGSYLSGEFFHYALLVDERFREVAEVLAAMPPQKYYDNQALFSALLGYDSELTSIQLHETPKIPWVSQFLTWWTIGIEGLIAVAFLAPPRGAIKVWRHILLLFFALATYSVAHVVGFGWLLMVMGVATTDRATAWIRILYVATFVVIQIYLVPWPLLLGLVS